MYEHNITLLKKQVCVLKISLSTSKTSLFVTTNSICNMATVMYTVNVPLTLT